MGQGVTPIAINDLIIISITQSFKKACLNMQTTLKKFAFFLAISLTCSCAQAQLVQTFGGVDCGVWIQDKKSSDRAWLLGYMTGLNLDSSGNPLGKITSAQQIFLWMDNYCIKSPLSNPVQGGRELLEELKKR